MQRTMTLALVAGLAAAAISMAAEPTAPAKPAPNKAIALVQAGPVGPALVSRVRQFVEDNIGVSVRLLPAQEPAGKTLDEEGAAVSALMTDRDICLVALVMPTEGIKAHGVILPQKHVAVVNAGALKPAGNDTEKYARRLERETMQSIGLLLGVSYCPNPQCVLWAYTTDDELDAKGRNFCPPCLEKVQRAARENGAKLAEIGVAAPP